MSVRHFDTAARTAKPAVKNAVPLEFTVDDRQMTAQPPTSGQLALFMTANRKGGVASIQALFTLLAHLLGDEDYAYLEEKLEEGMDVLLLTEMIQWMIEEWSGNDTKSSSASSASRKSTGRTSTAKPPTKVARRS